MEAGGAIQGGHQTPEGRAQESSERLISLLERMLNKYIIRQEKTVGKKWVHYNFSISFFFKCHIVNETT